MSNTWQPWHLLPPTSRDSRSMTVSRWPALHLDQTAKNHTILATGKKTWKKNLKHLETSVKKQKSMPVPHAWQSPAKDCSTFSWICHDMSRYFTYIIHASSDISWKPRSIQKPTSPWRPWRLSASRLSHQLTNQKRPDSSERLWFFGVDRKGTRVTQ